jgi:putative sigma-54 modulation protein
MQISITGHHVDVTEALKNYVTEKMERIERHFDKIVNVHVVLAVEKLVQKAEATVQVNGASLFAQEESEDLYAAIDGMVDKLDRQVVKHKEKVQEH